MTWLARLKKTAVGPGTYPAKPTKPGFGGFGGTPPALSQKSGGDAKAANDPTQLQDFGPEAFEERAAIIEFDGDMSRTEAEALAGMALDPDRHCWPNTLAMNTVEIDTFTVRVHLFNRHGLDVTQAESLADALVGRDRQADERRLCLECSHLRCGAGLWQCNQSKRAGLAVADVPGEVVKLLQRCSGFKEATW